VLPNPVVNRRKAIDYLDISYFHTYICTLHDVSCEGLRMSILLVALTITNIVVCMTRQKS
jgi:hypothetical protein